MKLFSRKIDFTGKKSKSVNNYNFFRPNFNYLAYDNGYYKIQSLNQLKFSIKPITWQLNMQREKCTTFRQKMDTLQALFRKFFAKSTLESKLEWVESISYESTGVSRVENIRLTLNTTLNTLYIELETLT